VVRMWSIGYNKFAGRGVASPSGHTVLEVMTMPWRYANISMMLWVQLGTLPGIVKGLWRGSLSISCADLAYGMKAIVIEIGY